jgi:hypothetical protein
LPPPPAVGATVPVGVAELATGPQQPLRLSDVELAARDQLVYADVRAADLAVAELLEQLHALEGVELEVVADVCEPRRPGACAGVGLE